MLIRNHRTNNQKSYSINWDKDMKRTLAIGQKVQDIIRRAYPRQNVSVWAGERWLGDWQWSVICHQPVGGANDFVVVQL